MQSPHVHRVTVRQPKHAVLQLAQNQHGLRSCTLRSCRLREERAGLISLSLSSQNPKGRPTFAELLQVLTEIAETW